MKSSRLLKFVFLTIVLVAIFLKGEAWAQTMTGFAGTDHGAWFFDQSETDKINYTTLKFQAKTLGDKTPITLEFATVSMAQDSVNKSLYNLTYKVTYPLSTYGNPSTADPNCFSGVSGPEDKCVELKFYEVGCVGNTIEEVINCTKNSPHYEVKPLRYILLKPGDSKAISFSITIPTEFQWCGITQMDVMYWGYKEKGIDVHLYPLGEMGQRYRWVPPVRGFGGYGVGHSLEYDWKTDTYSSIPACFPPKKLACVGGSCRVVTGDLPIAAGCEDTDFNSDGKVDEVDLPLLQSCYFLERGDPKYENCIRFDLNKDDKVNILDSGLLRLCVNVNSSCVNEGDVCGFHKECNGDRGVCIMTGNTVGNTKDKCDPAIPDVCKPKTYSIGDFVWEDKNYDGIQNDGASGIANTNVVLWPVTNTTCSASGAGAKIAQTLTNSNGFYEFSNLALGEYRVGFFNPFSSSGLTGQFTKSLQGGDTSKDSNGTCSVVSLSTSDDMTADAGFFFPVTLKIQKKGSDTGNTLLGGAMFNRDQGVAVYGPTVAGQELVPGGLNFPGTYTITETTPPTGYNLPPENERSQTVTLQSGETKTLTFIDTPIPPPPPPPASCSNVTVVSMTGTTYEKKGYYSLVTTYTMDASKTLDSVAFVVTKEGEAPQSLVCASTTGNCVVNTATKMVTYNNFLISKSGSYKFEATVTEQ